MGIILALIVVQNFMETKVARVSFSYQLEPLVNLDLIQPDESRKTASGANLVTFSGRFRDRLTDDGKNRYRYLDLLDQSHELAREKQQEIQELDVLKKRVKDSATLFLQLYGKPIPQGGFTVLDEIWDTPERENRIVITNVPKPSYQSFVEIDSKVLDLKNNSLIVTKNQRDLLRQHIVISPYHLINSKEHTRIEKKQVYVKVRSQDHLSKCKIRFLTQKRALIVLAKPKMSVSSGQFAVLYDGQKCLGNGRIIDSY